MENLQEAKSPKLNMNILSHHMENHVWALTFHQIQKVYYFVCSFNKWYPISHKGSHYFELYSHSFSFQMRSFMQIFTNDWVTAIKHEKKLNTVNWQLAFRPTADDMEEWWQFSSVLMQFITDSMRAYIYYLYFYYNLLLLLLCSIPMSFEPWALNWYCFCDSTDLSNIIYYAAWTYIRFNVFFYVAIPAEELLM